MPARLLVEDPIEHGKRLVVRTFTDRDATLHQAAGVAPDFSAAPQTIALLASTEQEPAALVFAHSVDLWGAALRHTHDRSAGCGGPARRRFTDHGAGAGAGCFTR